jgi:hypothetical protein
MQRLVIAWLAICVVNLVSANEPFVLENRAVRVAWEGIHGDLVSLVDRATMRDFVNPTAAVAIYSLRLADASGSTTTLTSHDAQSVRVRREAEQVIIEAVHRTPVALRVTCRFALDSGGRCVKGRIEAQTEVPSRLAAVQFPAVALRLPLSGAGDDDKLLLPVCDGYVVHNPTKYTFDRGMPYPGVASMQLLAAYDRAAGVYLASRDAEGYCKRLFVRSRRKSLVLYIDHLLPQSPLSRWELPYDVALTTFSRPSSKHGVTWETAADLYREWAVRQPWCRKTLAQRVAAGDVPTWLTEPSLFYAFSLGGQTKDKGSGNRLPLVAEHARQLREVLGMPVTFMMMSWEKHGAWVTPDYFPPVGGQESFTAVTRQLHQQGDRAMVFLSGLKWTLSKEFSSGNEPYDSQAEFDRRGRSSAISDAQGQASVVGKPNADVGRYAEICIATLLGHEILSGSTAACQQLGIDCVQADQIVGGGQPPCFHPQHGHPPGGGHWMSAALYEQMAAVRREGKARDHNFAFSIEEPGEFYIPVLDTYHARDYAQVRWPRSGDGIEGVPLFTHVYHDYLHGYGGDSCGVSLTPSRRALYEQAMNLVCGKAPAVAVWNRWSEPSQIDAAQRRLLRSHGELWRGPAHDFLVFGRRIAAPAREVPSLDISFTDKSSKKPRTLRFPSVLDGLWELPDGRRGHVFACIADRPVTFAVDGEKMVLAPGETAFRQIGDGKGN